MARTTQTQADTAPAEREAVLVPCTIRRQPTGMMAPWGTARVSNGRGFWDVSFTEGAIYSGGYLKGVIDRAAPISGQWEILIDNGLAGAVVTMPESLIVRAPAQLAAA